MLKYKNINIFNRFSIIIISAFMLVFLFTLKTHSFEGEAVFDKVFVYIVETYAGNAERGKLDAGLKDAKFNWPTGVIIGEGYNIYISDFGNNLIRKISPDGIVTTYAGNGLKGFADGKIQDAMFDGPNSLIADKSGNIYVADAGNFRIRVISEKNGSVSTVAGNGKKGFIDGEKGRGSFVYPTGMVMDRSGDFLYVVDRGAHAVRKVSLTGEIITLAGNGVPGYEDGDLKTASFKDPLSIIQTENGDLLVADSGNHAIRKITPDGIVSTLAGKNIPGFRNGQGQNARFYWPTNLISSEDGTIFVVDSKNNVIRHVSDTGVVTTIAGAIVSGFTDGNGMISRFKFPTGIFRDKLGNFFIADSGNSVIRKITVIEKDKNSKQVKLN